MSLINYLISFLISFLIVYFLIPPLRKLAFKINFLDQPRVDEERKVHKEPIPLTASIAIFAGFLIAYVIQNQEELGQTTLILFGGLLLVVIGLVDDWYKTMGKDFPSLPKFLIQIIPAILVYISDVKFSGIQNPFTGEYVTFSIWMQFILTVLWVFGVTTVINFSDGIDGLASSLSIISATTLFIVALVKGQSNSATMAIILIGAAYAYFLYNKPPAKIFMGDAGATFMGYILSVIALEGSFKQATILSILIPVLALAVPIFDNIFVVLKRLYLRKPIYQADTNQAHYRLLKTGLNVKQVILVLCLISICFGLSSIIILLLPI